MSMLEPEVNEVDENEEAADLSIKTVDDFLAAFQADPAAASSWAEENRETLEGWKRGEGLAPAEEVEAGEAEEEPAFADAAENELAAFISSALPRISDAEVRREVKEALEGIGGSAPDGSPQRLEQLRRAAVAAQAASERLPDFFEHPLNQRTVNPNTRELIEVDAFGNVRRSPLPEQSDEAPEQPIDPTRVQLADVAGWSADRWARWAEQDPDAAERLRRQASNAMDAQQVRVRQAGGTF